MNTRSPMSMLAAAGRLTASVLTLAEDAATADVAELLGSDQILSQEAIIKRATAQHPGKVSEVELERKGGRYIYEIDVVDASGANAELELDAKSGEILSSEMDGTDDDDD